MRPRPTSPPHRSALLVACSLAVLGACAAPPPGGVPSEADQWLGVDRAATFRAHVEQLDAIEVRSEASLARLGTTWEHELVEVEKLYREAKTPAEAYYALLALTNSFHDGHAFLRVDGLEPTSPEVTGPSDPHHTPSVDRSR